MTERLDTAPACLEGSEQRAPSALDTPALIAESLSALVEDYGLSGYVLITVPGETSTDFSSSVLLTSWPEEMLKSYDHAGLVFGSPVIERLRNSTIPFLYDSEATNRRRADGKAEIAACLFEKYGLPRGAYFPAHNSAGLRGALAFGGRRAALTAREMIELNAVANHVFTRMVALTADRSARADLSRREIECLSWASAGKTSLEMSEILGLSEYTVNHYLNRATRKLDAVNRPQAVAKAVRAGLLN
ncbi:LuxR family transcriptional regulator [Shinella daejeonensis]|uniref:helix-turn-helix transcriptional regulator n=1 Tax=Shinella daejeonensis TaxID=659017 RepID=UPI0020C7A393|nr:LuxR family transcriptional regulator [Shinella daejeonensis]MCP8897512.1 LuxR family transcriptional regulator [Shinella daejeonensis]